MTVNYFINAKRIILLIVFLMISPIIFSANKESIAESVAPKASNSQPSIMLFLITSKQGSTIKNKKGNFELQIQRGSTQVDVYGSSGDDVIAMDDVDRLFSGFEKAVANSPSSLNATLVINNISAIIGFTHVSVDPDNGLYHIEYKIVDPKGHSILLEKGPVTLVKTFP